MSKKSRWPKPAAKPVQPIQSSPAQTESRAQASTPSNPAEFCPISPAQLAANQANAQLSTGPRTAAGLAKSSRNAVTSALTGRTVLLPTDDAAEYARFLAAFQHDLKPLGQMESELVQIVADCHWRLRRIQELEYALYLHGERQFADALAHEPAENRHSMLVLQTHLTYQKELRNLHIQEARIDRKRAKALTELAQLQAKRTATDQAAPQPEETDSAAAPFASEAEFFAALDAGYVPPRFAPYLNASQPAAENGFVFSNTASASGAEPPSSV